MKWIYYCNRFLCSPLEGLYTLLIFILSNELNASLFQLTLIAMVKPAVSLFAAPLNGLISGKPFRIRHYLMGLNILGCLPCLFFPFVESVWFFIGAYFIFMVCCRASYPAWTELMKREVPLSKIGGTIATGGSINYLITIFLPLILSFWMDRNGAIWTFLFFGVALSQLLNTLLLSQLKSIESQFSLQPSLREGLTFCLKDKLFTKYLGLFFLGGAGLVALQPILPHIFKNELHLSYTQLTLAIGVCKGGAFVVASPLWARFVKRMSLYSLSAVTSVFSCLFIAFLLTSFMNTYLVFAAYMMYGVTHAGCELSTHLSPIFFSKEKESTLYSGVTLALIGVRGCLLPLLGQLLFVYSGSVSVLLVAGALCLAAIFYAIRLEKGLYASYA